MTGKAETWHELRAARGWSMPAAPRLARLPGVRHVRAALLEALACVGECLPGGIRIESPTHLEWLAQGIRLGLERQPRDGAP